MARSKPRIHPLKESEWNKEIREALTAGPLGEAEQIPNIFTTLAHHVKLLKCMLASGRHVMVESTLPPRDRELLILRIGWLCRSEYEWGQHLVRGRKAGLKEDEILRITKGPDASDWDPFDAALLHAVDELHADAFISDRSWERLASRYDTCQLMDLIFTVGQYSMVSMVLNSLGVELDEELEGFPKP